MSKVTRRTILKTSAALALSMLHRDGFAQEPRVVDDVPNPSPLTLWYRQPAAQWVEALPLGNGRLGAMVFGGVDAERLQLNEDTLWSGGPYHADNPQSPGALPEIRKLIFARDYAQATKLISGKMMGRPLTQMPYQTVGDLTLNFSSDKTATNYRRELDLDSAVARTNFQCDGVTFARETFISPVDQVIVHRISADKPKKIAFLTALTTPQHATIEADGADAILMHGDNPSFFGIHAALKFAARVKIKITGGSLRIENNALRVSDANSAIVLIAIATSYKNYNDVSGDPEELTKQTIQAAAEKSHATMLADHVAEHRRLFRRVSIDLGSSDATNLPTDERIRNSANADDPQLAALYFQYGRYLLISSSRHGTQPANLQGIWNDSTKPPWGSKYTININTEMNYWPAEPANLSECVEPLVSMLKDLSVTGAQTAKTMYNARGWVAHHNTDLWRACAPVDGPNWGIWPTGGAWLCKSLWDRYEFAGDKKYLADIYPVMKGAAEFFLDTLVEEPSHKWLVTCPSISPENLHHPGFAVCAGPTMDGQIIRDLFSHCITSSEILDVDADLRKEMVAARDRLPPNQIGAQGQLQEWLEDWDAQVPEIHHRHVSHLYGLFPSDQISPNTTPALAAAAQKSLETRGDLATGWAIAWRINLWARLLEGDHAHSVLKLLLDPTRTYPNLFDAHPPFQIDGNFGGVSGITEMLLQSHNQEIHLLPALPKAWPAGQITGLCARGGFEIDMNWKNNSLVNARITSVLGNVARVRSPARLAVTSENRSIGLASAEKDVIEFPTTAGKVYQLTNSF
jgi:alpha-L-fucosidase 2